MSEEKMTTVVFWEGTGCNYLSCDFPLYGFSPLSVKLVEPHSSDWRSDRNQTEGEKKTRGVRGHLLQTFCAFWQIKRDN